MWTSPRGLAWCFHLPSASPLTYSLRCSHTELSCSGLCSFWSQHLCSSWKLPTVPQGNLPWHPVCSTLQLQSVSWRIQQISSPEWTGSRLRAGPMSALLMYLLHLIRVNHTIYTWRMNEWHPYPPHDWASCHLHILRTHCPICKFGSFTPLGYRLMVISPRSSSKSCKQGALRDSFSLLLVELAFDYLE